MVRDTLLAARKLSITKYCGKFAIGVEDEELIQRKVAMKELLHFRGLGEMTKHSGTIKVTYCNAICHALLQYVHFEDCSHLTR